MTAAIERPADGLAKTLGFATAIQIIATAAALSLTAIVPLVVADVGLDVHFVGFQISLIYLAATLASAGAGGAIERLDGPYSVGMEDWHRQRGLWVE